jgi:hypothetical protein
MGFTMSQGFGRGLIVRVNVVRASSGRGEKAGAEVLENLRGVMYAVALDLPSAKNFATAKFGERSAVGQ